MKRSCIFLFAMVIIASMLLFPMNDASSQLNIVGSTSVQPICEELVCEYKKTHKNVDINVQGGGSSLGIKCSENNLADIGMSSKEFGCDGLKTYELGREGIVVVVHRDNPISDLSTRQIEEIFSGEITDWSELSNQSGKITVVVREEGSGTLDTFKKVIMNDSKIRKDAIIQNSAGAVKQSIIQDKNAIGFVSLAHADENIKVLSIDGVEISKKSIKDESYKLQRPFLLITNNTPSDETANFINWAISGKSQELLEKEMIFKVD